MEDDISDKELERLYDRLDREMEAGPPSDDELEAEIERLNKTAQQDLKRSGELHQRSLFGIRREDQPGNH